MNGEPKGQRCATPCRADRTPSVSKCLRRLLARADEVIE
jgi:hypothetical protein